MWQGGRIHDARCPPNPPNRSFIYRFASPIAIPRLRLAILATVYNLVPPLTYCTVLREYRLYSVTYTVQPTRYNRHSTPTRLTSTVNRYGTRFHPQGVRTGKVEGATSGYHDGPRAFTREGRVASGGIEDGGRGPCRCNREVRERRGGIRRRRVQGQGGWQVHLRGP
jgi:hypothetical protein